MLEATRADAWLCPAQRTIIRNVYGTTADVWDIYSYNEFKDYFLPSLYGDDQYNKWVCIRTAACAPSASTAACVPLCMHQNSCMCSLCMHQQLHVHACFNCRRNGGEEAMALLQVHDLMSEPAAVELSESIVWGAANVNTEL